MYYSLLDRIIRKCYGVIGLDSFSTHSCFLCFLCVFFCPIGFIPVFNSTVIKLYYETKVKQFFQSNLFHDQICESF